MSAVDLEAVYQDYIRCLNQQHWDNLSQFVHDDVEHNGRPLGLDGYRTMLERDYQQIPDLRFEIELLVAQPPRIACRLRFNVTPKADFLGLAVNGRKVTFCEKRFLWIPGREDQGRQVRDRQASDRGSTCITLLRSSDRCISAPIPRCCASHSRLPPRPRPWLRPPAPCYSRRATRAVLLAPCYSRRATRAVLLAPCYSRRATRAVLLAPCYSRRATRAVLLAPCYSRRATRAVLLAPCYSRRATRAVLLAPCYSRRATRAVLLAPCYSRRATRAVLLAPCHGPQPALQARIEEPRSPRSAAGEVERPLRLTAAARTPGSRELQGDAEGPRQPMAPIRRRPLR